MQEKNVVVIGGGPGTDIALLGLKRHTTRLTALVSTFDATARPHPNGHNGIPPAEDVRSSLLALGADPATTNIMERLFAYKFEEPDPLGSYTFGNLFLSALTEITGAVDLGLQAAARVLNVQGQVLPVTLEDVPLLAELNDGTETVVRTPIELRTAAGEAGLRRVVLSRPARALDAALRVIEDADIIVLGPSDFHFGIVAPLQLDGLSEALATSRALKIFVCNIMTQPGTTAGWPASRFIRGVLNYTGGLGSLDCVIVNSTPLAPEPLAAKASVGAFPVRFDLDECLSMGLNVIVRPVASPRLLTHDPEKLAKTVLFLGGGRSARRAERKHLFGDGPMGEVVTAPLAQRLAES